MMRRRSWGNPLPLEVWMLLAMAAIVIATAICEYAEGINPLRELVRLISP